MFRARIRKFLFHGKRLGNSYTIRHRRDPAQRGDNSNPHAQVTRKFLFKCADAGLPLARSDAQKISPVVRYTAHTLRMHAPRAHIRSRFCPREAVG